MKLHEKKSISSNSVYKIFSFDYDLSGYKKSDLVKVDILINRDKIEPLSFIVHKSNAFKKSKNLVLKLKEVIPQQQYAVPVQAAIGSKVIARETIRALRKDEKDAGEDREASYLNLDTVVLEAGLYAKGKHKEEKPKLSEIKERFDQRKASSVDIDLTKDVDPYYLAVGYMVSDLVSDERKESLRKVKNRTELGALVFTDCVLNTLNDSKKYCPEIKLELKNEDYLKASLIALQKLKEEISISRIRKTIMEGYENGA